MKKVLILTMVLCLFVGVAGFAGSYESNFNQIVLSEFGGEEGYVVFKTSDNVEVGKLAASDSDANAECLIFDLPTGGTQVVPVVLLTLADADFGYFNGQTQPALAIEDADGDAWIRLSFSADDTPAISVGGAASTITIPGVSGYSWTDDVSIDMGTGTDVSVSFTTNDANAHCLLFDLPTGSSTSVPAVVIASADSDFGYFNGIVEPTFAVENLAGTGYVGLDFSGTTLSRLITGGATTQLSIISPLVYFGVDGTGEDVTFYGDTASYKVWWDYNGDTNGAWYFGADDYGVDVEFYGQTADYNVTWDASADDWLFGADDLGVDVFFYGAGTGNYVTFDESIDTASFVDYNIKIDDDAVIYVGTGTNVTTADGDFEIESVSDSRMNINATAANGQVCIGDGTVASDFLVDNITVAGADVWFDASADTANGAWYFGKDDAGVDVYFYGATAGDYVLFDFSADELVVEDITINLMDDTILSFGDSDDATIQFDADGDADLQITGTASFDSTVIFSGGQTKFVVFTPKDVELDGTAPAALSDTGTDGQTNISALQFDADGGATGDDFAFISWKVPAGYVTDSARLNVAYTFSTAEDAADEAQFDFTVNAVAAGEALDAAGTALADQATVIADASADNGKLFVTQYNIEVEDIVIGDLVTIQIAVDESASALANSGTLDVLYFEIQYESTE